MSHKRDNHSQKLIGFVIIGGLVGAGAALLLTKKSAKEIFQDMSHQAHNCVKSYGKHKLLCNSVVGTLLCAISGLFLAPKSGSQLRHYLTDTYQEVNDRTWELLHSLNQKGGEAAEAIAEQTIEWMEKTIEIADEVTSEVDAWAQILKSAASRARTIATHMEEDSRQQQHILEVVEWSQRAVELANQVTHEAQNWTGTIREVVNSAKSTATSKEKEVEANPIANVIEWAVLGMNLWQHIQKRH